jgi:hypothetical protein
LILAYQVKNESFKHWLDKELDGYDSDDVLPDYRLLNSISRGLFLGPMGAQINNQPLSLHVLSEKDREKLMQVRLTQPIASYDAKPDKGSDAQIPWSPTLTAKYQSKFYEGYALNRAWQEIPGSCLIGLLETVRNRVLRFALELRDDLKQVGDKVESVPAAQIQQSVVNHIYNGNVVVAGQAAEFQQVQNTSIVQNDLHGLLTALKELGLAEADVVELEHAVKNDGGKSLGARTAAWLKQLPSALGRGSIKIGFEVAKAAATKYVLQYFGLH